jgi:hypothetical protein
MSPDQRYAIFVEGEVLNVCDMRLLEVARLVNRPLGTVTRADLDALDTEGLTGAARAAVELLRACLTGRPAA